MITLTAPQEAAFNAAGEAMQDIAELGYRIAISASVITDAPISYSVWTGDHPNTIWGKGDTLAEAVANCLTKSEEEKAKPRKLRTAAEAIEAVRGLLKEEDPLRAKLDELPVA